MDHTLILVDYNSIPATVSYIDRCRDAFSAAHVVIIENGTEDTNSAHVQKAYGSGTPIKVGGKHCLRFDVNGVEVLYCHSGGNLGYAKGNNLGAQIAKEVWSDAYYIISNNDLFFESALDLSISKKLFEAHPQIGVIGPHVKTPTGEVQSPRKQQSAYQMLILSTWIQAAGVFLPTGTHKRLIEKHVSNIVLAASTGSYAWVSGCFFVAKADVFHKAGMFDENTFLYGEEMILSKRLEAIGSQVWFCRELEVVHCHAQTTRNVLSEIKMQELSFGAIWHYFKTYTHTSAILLVLAKWNFALYRALFYSWQKVKKLAKRG